MRTHLEAIEGEGALVRAQLLVRLTARPAPANTHVPGGDSLELEIPPPGPHRVRLLGPEDAEPLPGAAGRLGARSCGCKEPGDHGRGAGRRGRQRPRELAPRRQCPRHRVRATVSGSQGARGCRDRLPGGNRGPSLCSIACAWWGRTRPPRGCGRQTRVTDRHVCVGLGGHHRWRGGGREVTGREKAQTAGTGPPRDCPAGREGPTLAFAAATHTHMHIHALMHTHTHTHTHTHSRCVSEIWEKDKMFSSDIGIRWCKGRRHLWG